MFHRLDPNKLNNLVILRIYGDTIVVRYIFGHIFGLDRDTGHWTALVKCKLTNSPSEPQIDEKLSVHEVRISLYSLGQNIVGIWSVD
jgi:hypothetical protein